MKTRVLLIVAALIVGGCTAPASASPTPTASPSATVAPTSSATASPAPTTVRGSTLVPPIVSRAQYGDMGITLDIPDRLGQPAEDIVWHVDPFKPEPGYPARIASAMGLAGPGIRGDAPAGAAPGSNGPWRLWFGDRVLAVNETSGEIYYFDPNATDGPAPVGSARRDPADVLRLLLNDFGWAADVAPSLGGPASFRGTEVTARAEHIINGSWLRPGYRETAVLFPRYRDPTAPRDGPRIYGTDHLALLSATGRPAEIIHRPAGRITGGAVYPITPFGQARSELLASPLRYLHFLSNPTGEPLKLTVGEAYQGSAWGGFSAGGLTHNGQMLIPVWVFPASGTTASGIPVDAIFIVDAVVPALRAQGLGGTSNLNADILLRYQLDTLGGQNMELLTARGAIRFFLNSNCGPIIDKEDTDTASGTVTCGTGPTISFTVKRAFPGLASSIWYLSDSRK